MEPLFVLRAENLNLVKLRFPFSSALPSPSMYVFFRFIDNESCNLINQRCELLAYDAVVLDYVDIFILCNLSLPVEVNVEMDTRSQKFGKDEDSGFCNGPWCYSYTHPSPEPSDFAQFLV
ncbi:hypothetical protein Dimus_027891 [Dionaea muscipula]